MTDKNKLAKLREIGMRFVETCLTCKYLAQKPGGDRPCWCPKQDVDVGVVDVCNDYKKDGSARQVLNTRRLTVVGTPSMHWVACQSCKWAGWSTALVTHWLSAGGEDIVTEACPKCSAEVPRA